MKKLAGFFFFMLSFFFFFGSYFTIRDQGSSWTGDDLFVLASLFFTAVISLLIGLKLGSVTSNGTELFSYPKTKRWPILIMLVGMFCMMWSCETYMDHSYSMTQSDWINIVGLAVFGAVLILFGIKSDM